MEDNQKNEVSVTYVKEKRASNAPKILLILITVILVSIISSFATYLIVTKSGNMVIKGANNVTYDVENVENPVVAVAQIAGPSVVGVSVSYYEQSFFTGALEESESEGSGIIYSEDGYIITNYHVIADALNSSIATVKVTLSNEEEYEAEIVGSDETTDLALLKIDAKDLTAAKFGKSSELNVGEYAIAIGNPLGREFAGSVTVGYISALNRSINSDGRSYKVIQTDAAINPGNSGGALVNSKGEVIGINTAKINDTSVEGLGFAIPSDDALVIIEELKISGKIIRPYIGIYGIDLDEMTAKRNNLEVGIYVYQIQTGSPAHEAGVQKGDVIVEFDGKEVKTTQELNEIKNTHKIGDKVHIKVYRKGEYKEGDIVLGSDELTEGGSLTN